MCKQSVSGLGYSFDNCTAKICELEHFRSPQVYEWFCKDDTSWLPYDDLREKELGRVQVDQSTMQTNLCNKPIVQTSEFFLEVRYL